MESVIVLDGEQRSALAVTRSLGRHGLIVVVGSVERRSLAATSRYCNETFVYPSPDSDRSGFLESIQREASRVRAKVVIPATDLTTSLLLEKMDAVEDFSIPFGDYAAYERLSNKQRLFLLAMELGIRVPNTWFLSEPGDITKMADEWTFPVVVKPVRSRVRIGGVTFSTTVKRIDSLGELERHTFNTPYLAGQPFMIQEFIEGSGEGVFGLCDRGEPVVFFGHRRIREKPPEGGVAVLSSGMEPRQETREWSIRLLKVARWHGAAMVEWKVTADGVPYLMEVNARLWGSLQLAVDSGVDFPYYLYLLGKGETVPREVSYRAGQRLRWLLGDIDRLLITLKRGEQRRGLTRARVLKEFFFNRKCRHEVNRWDDPMPFLTELKSYLKALM